MIRITGGSTIAEGTPRWWGQKVDQHIATDGESDDIAEGDAPLEGAESIMMLYGLLW